MVDFELGPKELAAALTSLGLECDTIEEVETVRGGLKGIVIGKVLTCEPHPNSDHLHITTCDLGTGEPVQIVCGAPNVAAGQTVVVATVGTTLYSGDDEFKIKKSKIRGVESLGMICAEDEIGVGSSHDGIMVLDTDLTPGTPAATYFQIESDWRLEVELTPNRVDAASHLGVARDLKAWLLARKAEGDIALSEEPIVRTPSVEDFHTDTPDGAATIKVIDTEGCPRYCGVTIKGVTVKESPDWLKRLLEAAGQRPINNIVDITNFILLGLGQPLHSFDLDKVKGATIEVRTCPAGTHFTTLDGVERTLHEADLMICDTEKPLCIAGVFGGEDSGVTDATTNIFIESAYFNPTRVRRTARRHGLSTDASFRYERGTDPNILPYAAKLAAIMIKELAGGEICGPVLDTCPEGFPWFNIDLDADYARRLIGKEIPTETMANILRWLDIEVKSEGETLHLQVPPYRVDVTRPCDVVEEILRVYGYNNVEFGMEMHANLSQKEDTDFAYSLQSEISDYLSARGFSEIMNNSLTSVEYYEGNEAWPIEQCVKIMNPLSRDLGVMRSTLLYGGLEVIAHNCNRRITDLQIYEFGNVYSMTGHEPTPEAPLAPYSEGMRLALWMTGNSTTASWNTKEAETTFFDLKAVAEGILRKTGANPATLNFVQKKNAPWAAYIEITNKGGKHIGSMGILNHAELKRFDISQPVVYAEFDWKALCKIAKGSKVEFSLPPKTQPVKRDLALLLDATIPFSEVEQTIAKCERKLLQGVTLFDVYEGKNIPSGKKSYAVSITLQDNEKTLNDKQIDSIIKKITENLKKNLGAELR